MRILLCVHSGVLMDFCRYRHIQEAQDACVPFFLFFFFCGVFWWWSPVLILNDEIIRVKLVFVRRMLVLCVKLREYGGVLYTQSEFHMLSHIGKVLKLRFG